MFTFFSTDSNVDHARWFRSGEATFHPFDLALPHEVAAAIDIQTNTRHNPEIPREGFVVAIRKRSWTTRKGETKEAWVADYIDQRKRRHIKTFKRKKDADAWLPSAKVQVREGTHTPDADSVTVAQAGDLWITTAEQNLERATVALYRQHLRDHIVPHIGATKLPQLSVPGVRAFEDTLSRNGCSRAMVVKIRNSLSGILTDAQERGMIAHNVVRDLRARRRRGKERQAERRERGKLKVGIDIPMPDEIKAILAHAEGRWRPLLLTAVFCGLRASEIRGLRWADIDFKKSELHVTQRADRFNTIGNPKTEDSERTVPIPPGVLSVLKSWKLECPKGSLDLVFPNGAGRIENHGNIVRRGLWPIQIEAGITVVEKDDNGKVVHEDAKPVIKAKYTGLHCMRHFFASWCINREVDGGLELPVKVVQERLGHSTAALTTDLYGHLFPRGDDTAKLAAGEARLLG